MSDAPIKVFYFICYHSYIGAEVTTEVIVFKVFAIDLNDAWFKAEDAWNKRCQDIICSNLFLESEDRWFRYPVREMIHVD